EGRGRVDPGQVELGQGDVLELPGVEVAGGDLRAGVQGQPDVLRLAVAAGRLLRQVGRGRINGWHGPSVRPGPHPAGPPPRLRGLRPARTASCHGTEAWLPSSE